MSKANLNIIVITTMYPNTVIYRSGVFVHEQVKKFIELGINVNVVAPIPFVIFPLELINPRYKKYKKVPKFEIIDGVKIYHPKFAALPGGFLKHLWPYFYFISARKIIKNLLGSDKYNIFHVHGSLPDNYGTYLFSKFFKIKYILTIHGASVFQTKNKKQFQKTLTAVRNADIVICVSNTIKNKIIEITNRKNNLEVIYNGINFYRFQRERNDKKIRILTVASLIERKGIKYVIEALNILIRKYNNLEYVIIGKGSCESELKQMVNKYKLNDQVKFHPFLAHKEILTEMNNSDIFILPSWDEAFGVVYIEAMSFKIPVIGTKGEGISDIIEDGKNGFLAETKNISEIIEKLSKLISDEKLRKEIGTNGYNTIKDLTWKNNAIQYVKLYKSLINNSS